MPKENKAIYICSNCGAQFPKWFGQCPECGAWGTLKKQEIIADTKKIKISEIKAIPFKEIKTQVFSRIKTDIRELDNVFGGGIVNGSLILLGGEPGIGKSTLVLQIAHNLAKKNIKKSVLYISGEESGEQIKMRMNRLEIFDENIKFLGETNIEKICLLIKKIEPLLVIIDSIQTTYSAEIESEPGSINQVRVCTVKLLEIAKKYAIPIFLIGHITKGGVVAGPKTLEHLVDTVVYLEGDRYHQFRLLRTVKNRFGTTDEIGVFKMTNKGLIEVQNPSEVFLSSNRQPETGIVTGVIIKGTRPFLIEIQSLVTKTHYGYPQRRAIGFDINRLELLIAVLSKRLGLGLGNYDIHLNIAGGIRANEPAVDFPVCLSMISAFKNKIFDKWTAVFGEVGLGAEIRPVSATEKRIKAAEKIGFKKIFIPKVREKINKSNYRIKIIEVENLKDILRQ